MLSALVLAAVPPRAEAADLPFGVNCVLEAMTVEEREIALFLVVDELVGEESNNRKRASSPRQMEIDRLLQVAQDRCLDRWAWTESKSRGALAWARSAIYREANAQAISDLGRDPAMIDEFVTLHRSEISAGPDAAALWLPALRKHLAELGWGDRNARAVGFAGLYFTETITQGTLARNFARGLFRADGS